MNNEDAKVALEEFGELQLRNSDNQSYSCPRCGKDNMKSRVSSNAFSRYFKIYICERCGIDEGIRMSCDSEISLSEWAFIKELDDVL